MRKYTEGTAREKHMGENTVLAFSTKCTKPSPRFFPRVVLRIGLLATYRMWAAVDS
jgi:hypothetical protein